MTRLSVNINKVALLRNSRGGNLPNLLQVALDCERFGAQGITIHPRPDERHIRYADIEPLRRHIATELNIEGNPRHRAFMDLVLLHHPHQCTLVPDAVGALTSDSGWDTRSNRAFLQDTVAELQAAGIRVSLFVNANPDMVLGAKETGADRVEFYTGPYAEGYTRDPQAAIAPYLPAAQAARSLGIGINAGHDLNLDNLAFFKQQIPDLLEVSIGHALIADALYYGLQNTVQLYKHRLK